MSIVVHGVGPEDGEGEPHSQQDRAAVLERVEEEMRMTELLVRQVDLRESLATHVVSALRESLLTRIFRLRHFFYGNASGKAEVVAADYFANPSLWAEIRPPAPPHLSRWLDDLGVWIESRLRLERGVRVPPEAWPLTSLVEALAETYQVFREAVVEHGEGPESNPGWQGTVDEDNLSCPA